MKQHLGTSEHPITLVGSFQPAAIARLLPPEAAEKLAGLTNFAGVPINMLAKGLVERGIPTTLVGGIRGAASILIESDLLTVAIYGNSGGWPFLLTGRRAERQEILQRLAQIQPSIVHAHWTLEAGRAVGDWNGPKVLTIHDAAWEYARLGRSLRPTAVAYTARWLFNTETTLARYRHLIAVSPYVESYLRIRHRFRGEIRVIPNGIPDLPTDLHVPSVFPKTGIVTFASYGEPGRLKNVSAALKAFAILGQTMSDVRLLVFGDGWKREADSRRDPRIEFRGALQHAQFLKCLAEEVDIWVHPSLIETHGISICEAILAGCPVIAGMQSGAVSWTLDYGKAGLLVDVEIPAELAEAMRTMVTDRRRAEESVTYGRQFIRSNFNPERVLELHLQYYEDIISI